MQRMSDPQIVDALTAMSTSPWPGSGTGTVLVSTVLFPGRNAAIIVFDIRSISSFVRRWQALKSLREGSRLPL
jgi:hypothetical protein